MRLPKDTKQDCRCCRRGGEQVQDKSGIQRLKSRSAILALTQMPNSHTGKTGSNGCWGRCRLGSTHHAKYIHVGEWEAVSGSRSISGPGLAECRFFFRPKVKHELRWKSSGRARGIFLPSLPLRPFAIRVKPSLASSED